MEQLQTFDFNEMAVRIMDRDGLPWFVAADVCRVLEIANARDAVASLEEDEKGVGITDTLGGTQKMNIINESGLYSLIFRSRKVEARQFRKWVTGEVLPALRRHGHYGAGRLLTVAEYVRMNGLPAGVNLECYGLTCRRMAHALGAVVPKVKRGEASWLCYPQEVLEAARNASPVALPSHDSLRHALIVPDYAKFEAGVAAGIGLGLVFLRYVPMPVAMVDYRNVFGRSAMGMRLWLKRERWWVPPIPGTSLRVLSNGVRRVCWAVNLELHPMGAVWHAALK